jgi:hypothetical protein
VVISTTVSTSTSPNTTLHNAGAITSSTPLMGNADDDIVTSPCTRSTTAAREYAFVDCGEVYLAGKRTSGIYEIW